jgi:hypothetical protein
VDEVTEAAPAAATALPNLDPLVEKYLALRQRKADLKAKFDADTANVQAALDKAEAFFRGVMLTQGLTSLPTRFGTPYLARQTSVSVADKLAFKRWLLEDLDRFDAYIDLKANKTSVVAYKEEHKDLPPGLNWREELGVNVRKN